MPNRLASIHDRERALLAPYAMRSAQSAGREHAEPEHAYRGPFQRDRDRILHSAAFRRLSAKTQVFTGELGDYHRTRLTHTLEVACIARTIGRELALNEDLVEALALIHDLGHPPLGHPGEDLLDECLRDEGGFSHNAQALRIVRELELRYSEFPGLNLTREVLAGQETRVTHDTTQARPPLEVQVVDAADSIAYDAHDADDALELRLLSLEELLATRLWSLAAQRVRRHYAALSAAELRRAILRELVDWQVGDVLGRAAERIARSGVDSPAAVARAEPIVVPGEEIAAAQRELQDLLRTRVYRHADVLAHRRQATAQLQAMFDLYVARPELMTENFRRRVATAGPRRTAADYIAGMTDRFAAREFQRLLGGPTPGLVTPLGGI
ncbi:MAG: dGTP triphosphohydrolase [Pirellulales bacterium]